MIKNHTVTNPTLSVNDQCPSSTPDVTVSWTPVAGVTYAVEFFGGADWGPVDALQDGTATKNAVPFGSGYAFRISTTADGCTSVAPSVSPPFSVIAKPVVPIIATAPDVCDSSTVSTFWTGETGVTYELDLWNGTSWTPASVSGGSASGRACAACETHPRASTSSRRRRTMVRERCEGMRPTHSRTALRRKPRGNSSSGNAANRRPRVGER
jgi:hypothetical protein